MGLFDFLKGRDEGRDVDELARRIGIQANLLEAIKPQYSEFKVPKRSGGFRTLSVPEPKLKEIQKLILRRVLGRLRAHPAAHGFEKGKSVATNAAPHAGKPVILRMDIQDFFPTTSASRVEAYFRSIGWNRKAAALLTKLTTWKKGLPQGAPTSPRLSNLVNYKLDQRMTRLGERIGETRVSSNPTTGETIKAAGSGVRAVYTRYADDLTFSFDQDSREDLRVLLHKARTIALDEGGYRIHSRKKLRISRGHQSQRVTGVVVNERPRLPRETRRRLRAIEHRLRTRGEATLTEDQLKGWRAYEGMIERQGK